MTNPLFTQKTADEEPQPEASVKSHALPMAGALGATALAAPLAYMLARRYRKGGNSEIQAIQRASKGQFSRVVEGEKPGPIKHLWNRLLRAGGGNVLYTKDPNLPRRVEGAVHHAGRDGTKLVRGDVNLAANKATQRLHDLIKNDKWNEYKMWNQYAPGAMGKSENIADVLKSMNIDMSKIPKTPSARAEVLTNLQNELRQRYGKGFLLKDTISAETLGKFPTEKTDFAKLRQDYRNSDVFRQRQEMLQGGVTRKDVDYMQARKQWRHDPNYSGRVLEALLKNPQKVMVQEKLPIQQLTGARALASKALGLPLSKEVRVHVHNGAVVPDLTFHRYDPAARVLGHEHAEGANAYARELVSKLPPQYRNGSFAMDLAPLRGGKNQWGMIESNPSGKSGFFQVANNPMMGPLSHLAYTGRNSKMLSGAMAGVAGTGAGAAAYTAMRPQAPAQPPVQNQEEPQAAPQPAPAPPAQPRRQVFTR